MRDCFISLSQISSLPEKSPYLQLFWSVFSCIRTENGPGYSPNTGHFLRSALKIIQNYKIHKIIQLFPTREKYTSQMYSEPCLKSKMELFQKTVNGFQPLTIFAKSST